MRLVGLLISLAFLFSGCLALDIQGPVEPVIPIASTGLFEQARDVLLEYDAELDTYELRAVHAVEAHGLAGRDDERGTAPIGPFLYGDDTDRLDGLAVRWVFFYAHPDGTKTASVRTTGDRFTGYGQMIGGTHPYLENLDAGTTLLQEPSLDSVAAARLARASGLYDVILDDVAWDLRMTLQHWKGHASPVWLFEAVEGESSERRLFAIDSDTGERVPAAERPLVLQETVAGGALVPGQQTDVLIEVPPWGYDELEIRLQPGFGTRLVVYDPHGTEASPQSFEDPIPGVWTVRLMAPLVVHDGAELTFCLAEEPTFREGRVRSPCEA